MFCTKYSDLCGLQILKLGQGCRQVSLSGHHSRYLVAGIQGVGVPWKRRPPLENPAGHRAGTLAYLVSGGSVGAQAKVSTSDESCWTQI